MEIILLSSLGLLKVSGQNAKSFLQGQLTCDMNRITPSSPASPMAHCDVKGRVKFSGYVLLFEEAYYLCVPAEMVLPAQSVLGKYALFSRVDLNVVDATGKIYGFMSQNQLSFPAEKSAVYFPVGNDPTRCLGIFFESKMISFEDYPIMTDENRWNYFNIKAGLPIIYMETSGLFTPHALNYPQLDFVSLNKGCYTGQEIIARMHFLGKLKESLCRFHVEGDKLPKRAGKIMLAQGTEVGTIVDSCRDLESGFIGLMVVRHEALSSKLFWEEKSIDCLR